MKPEQSMYSWFAEDRRKFQAQLLNFISLRDYQPKVTRIDGPMMGSHIRCYIKHVSKTLVKHDTSG